MQWKGNFMIPIRPKQNQPTEGELHVFVDWRERRIEVMRLLGDKPGISLGYVSYEELAKLIEDRM